MVSIKSLAVLLFAAAVTAAPLAGETKHDSHNDNPAGSLSTGNICGNGQEIKCCNEDTSSKNAGVLGLLGDVKVQCTNLPLDVVSAINPVKTSTTCKGTVSCCSKNGDATAGANIDLACEAAPGFN